MLMYFLNLLPPLFILALMGWSYYSYVFQFAPYCVEGPIKRSIYLGFFHFIMVMLMWCFLQAMFKSHRKIPEEYRLGSIEDARLLTYSEQEADHILKKMITLRQLEINTCTPNGRIRYCKHCKQIKPDRTHHCTTCGRCILKMDHHCPWIYNCVGYSNYKQFILTLLYGMLWCAFYAATVAEYLVDVWRDFQNNLGKLTVGIGFIMAAFSGMLVSILFFYHVGLVCRNETTLEALRETTFRSNNVTFDLGQCRNFLEVFGDNVCCWLIPVHSARNNGYEFHVGRLIG